MSLHLTYINYFANGATFCRTTRFCARQTRLRRGRRFVQQPLLVLVGVGVFPGSFGWASSARRSPARRSGAGAAALPSWGFFALAGWSASRRFSGPAGELFFQDYAGNIQLDWAWKSLPLALLVTQRGFLFALACGAAAAQHLGKASISARTEMAVAVLGRMAAFTDDAVLFQYTFIALSFVLAVLFVAHRASYASLRPCRCCVHSRIGSRVSEHGHTARANAQPDWIDMSQADNPPPARPRSWAGSRAGWSTIPRRSLTCGLRSSSATRTLADLSGHGYFVQFGSAISASSSSPPRWLGPRFRQITGRPISAARFALGVLGFCIVTPFLGMVPVLPG